MNCHSTGLVTHSPYPTFFSPSHSVGRGFGRAVLGAITNCFSTASVTSFSYSIPSSSSSSSYAGGLVGCQYSGTITDCCSTGSVSSHFSYFASSSPSSSGSCVGGLVGWQYSGVIIDCCSIGSVSSYFSTNSSSSSSSFSSSSGGLVGLIGSQSSSGTITNCFSTGPVTASASFPSFKLSFSSGGLVGSQSSSSTITNCYSTGSVTSSSRYSYSDSYTGGLVGYQSNSSSATIENCYSTGQVSATGNYNYGGGLLGYYGGSGTVTACFWDTNTSGLNTSADGTGMTTSQMKTLSTFTSAGWDFTNETANGTNDYWRMCVDGVNYPQLNWGYARYGDFACPDGVGMEDFTYFVQRWLESDCSYANNNDCGGTDMDASGTVDFKDFAIFANNWLSGE